jgi:hypothetical protein
MYDPGYNHKLVAKNYHNGTEYLVVVTCFDPRAMEEYNRPLHSFSTREQAQAWLTDYYTPTNDVPF